MLDLISQYVPADLLASIVGALVAIGAVLKALAFFFGSCSMVVVGLRLVVNKVLPWAENTETKLDDKALGIVASFLTTVGPAFERARIWCEHAALNKLFAEKKGR